MAAAAALIRYIQFNQNILFAQRSLKIAYSSIDLSCLIGLPLVYPMKCFEM
jgi:hypothetical protein